MTQKDAKKDAIVASFWYVFNIEKKNNKLKRKTRN